MQVDSVNLWRVTAKGNAEIKCSSRGKGGDADETKP